MILPSITFHAFWFFLEVKQHV